nr:cryptochrome/photolyase family protein [Paracoccaceae bacterium]
MRLRLILGDQLSETVSSLQNIDKINDIILICEVHSEATYVKHHKKKIAFLFSAMRHFAEDLLNQGYNVLYTKYDDESNTGSLLGEVKRVLNIHRIEKIILTKPNEYRVFSEILKWSEILGFPVEIKDDDRFLCTTEEFNLWAKERKQIRMEFFYRNMRRKYSILMDGDQP